MSETEFLEQVEAVLTRIENRVEALADELDSDLEASRSGNVLSIELADRSKIIVNSQVAMLEIWVAAKTGGFHYRYDGNVWRNTRDASELFAALEKLMRADPS